MSYPYLVTFISVFFLNVEKKQAADSPILVSCGSYTRVPANSFSPFLILIFIPPQPGRVNFKADQWLFV